MKNLYKVRVETDIMVVSDNESSAIKIAKKNASGGEIEIYGRGEVFIIKSMSDIPEDWKSVIPFSEEGVQETRKCYEIVGNSNKNELPKEDIDEIMKIKNNSKASPVVSSVLEVKPETRPDPKPKELDWHETKSGRPMPVLRFVRK